jgi:hypothetical protein
MRKATRLALEGNLAAMRFVLERACGRAAEAPADGVALDLQLPKLRTAVDCAAAIDQLTAAICDGTVDRDHAKVLLDVVQARLKAIEVNDLDQRLVELEKALGTVDARGNHLRRL